MSEDKSIKFLDMFPFCGDFENMCGGLDKAVVKNATVNKEKLNMAVTAVFQRTAAPAELHTIEGRIAAEFGLNSVVITAQSSAPIAPSVAKSTEKKGKSQAAHGKTIFGRNIKGEPVPMNTLNLESGNVVVSGEVFMVENREIQKTKAWVLCFEMTDYTGSVRVSKYFKPGDDRGSLAEIKTGMYLTVSGNVSYNRYDEDIALEPRNVVISAKPKRVDTAETKRVELHLHTRYSTLDALTDPKDVVKRAAEWGHPAIAVTDHGVAQAFPEVWHAGEKCGIKILYGVEGYYINDVDDKLAVNGEADGLLSDEFCAFDLETTGLSANEERIPKLALLSSRTERSFLDSRPLSIRKSRFRAKLLSLRASPTGTFLTLPRRTRH